MFITTYHFAGDPGDLLPRYRALVAEIGPENLQLHVAGTSADGLHIVDACPDRAARDGWVTEALPELLARHGLPQPALSDGFDAHVAVVDGAEAAVAAR